ncbi:MAG: hypothetical protein KAR13_06925 [Desulfobulbaceae bacterium]|nr:hypothetical protein [Desulfobulbaceae bacterium]
MYAQVEKPKESKSRAVANAVTQKKSAGERSFGFVDNRTQSLQLMQNSFIGSPTNVVQRVTYKGVEYSRELDNIQGFHIEANQDLDSLDPTRNKSRDKTMLSVIGNSEHVVDNPMGLIRVIHPVGKGYQIILNNEMRVLSPKIEEIIELTIASQKMAPKLRKDDSTESHEYVILNMVEVREKTDDVKKRVQWKKIDAIDPLAETVIENAQYSMMSILQYRDESIEPSKQQLRNQKKQEVKLEKGEGQIIRNTNTIVETATQIEPTLRTSTDEQYLRGTVGAKPDEHGGRHINIGKKTATKPLLDTNAEEAKGILWASVWSQGVNEAFVEGGTDSDYEFRLISPFPLELEHSLKTGNIEEFIQTAKRGTIEANGENPWRAYYHLGNDDLTTLGKEIVQLLENGYVLEE